MREITESAHAVAEHTHLLPGDAAKEPAVLLCRMQRTPTRGELRRGCRGPSPRQGGRPPRGCAVDHRKKQKYRVWVRHRLGGSRCMIISINTNRLDRKARWRERSRRRLAVSTLATSLDSPLASRPKRRAVGAASPTGTASPAMLGMDVVEALSSRANSRLERWSMARRQCWAGRWARLLAATLAAAADAGRVSSWKYWSTG